MGRGSNKNATTKEDESRLIITDVAKGSSMDYTKNSAMSC